MIVGRSPPISRSRQLAVIDTTSHKVKTWVELPGTGYGTAPTPDGNWLVVAMPTVHKVGVVNLKTMKLEHAIDVPAAPQEVLVRPDGAVAYVSCDASHKVAEIRTSDWTVARLIDAGAGADGLAWARQTVKRSERCYTGVECKEGGRPASLRMISPKSEMTLGVTTLLSLALTFAAAQQQTSPAIFSGPCARSRESLSR